MSKSDGDDMRGLMCNVFLKMGLMVREGIGKVW